MIWGGFPIFLVQHPYIYRIIENAPLFKRQRWTGKPETNGVGLERTTDVGVDLSWNNARLKVEVLDEVDVSRVFFMGFLRPG